MRLLLFLLLPALLLAQPARLGTGDAVPDCAFISQDGEAFQLSRFKGRAVAVTFIFTRCPLPDYCPRLSARFAEAQRLLMAEKGWHLLSLSFDPAHDTPEQLRAYARGQGADSACWTFATAQPGVVRAFGALFGLTAEEKAGLLDHNLRTVVIDAGGHVQHIFEGNAWTAEELVWEMKKAKLTRP